jgi:glycosyltransferase involved in cell wall biosynthesis
MSTSNQDALVSIVFPVFNESADYITKSIDSILNQTYGNIEVLVMDDSNKPHAIDAVNKYQGHPKVRILRTGNKRGLTIALNDGLAAATGVFVARADADDIQHPQRIEKQVAFLNQHPDYMLVGTSVIYIDEQGNQLKQKLYPETHNQIARAMHLHNPISHPTVLARRQLFTSLGFYDVQLQRAEDYDLWFRAKQKGYLLHNLQEPLVQYRVSNIQKRDDLNWKTNLQIKRKYFSYRYFVAGVIGVFTVWAFLNSPKALKNYIYNKFS